MVASWPKVTILYWQPFHSQLIVVWGGAALLIRLESRSKLCLAKSRCLNILFKPLESKLLCFIM